jgi:regulator of sigma E protease
MLINFFAILFTFGVLILFHEFGHFLVAKRLGVGVEKFSLGLGPKLIGLKKGETEYCLSLIPFGGYVKLAGEDPHEELKGEKWEFLSRSIGARFSIIIAGPLANFILAFLLFSLIFAIGFLSLSTEIGEVLKDTPASRAGLKAGDRIVAIGDEDTRSGEELQEIVYAHPGEELKFTIEREGERFILSVVPEPKKVRNVFGEEEEIGMIGIAFSEEPISMRYGLGEAITKGLSKTVILTRFTCRTFAGLISGKISPRNLGGPIFIAQAAGAAARMGFNNLLHLIGLISVNLFVINLLPIPLLDGGHILFLFLEGLRKRPLSIKAQEITQYVGLVVILLIALFVIYNDVFRIRGG